MLGPVRREGASVRLPFPKFSLTRVPSCGKRSRMHDDVLDKRRKYSETRLTTLRQMLAKITELEKSPDLCIYITYKRR